MRRIYESDALKRDDEPFTPSERRRRTVPLQAFRSIDSTGWSKAILPERLTRRAIEVEVSTLEERYRAGEPIPFKITMRNPWPIPVVLRTESPLRWYWTVDGHLEASHVRTHRPPDEGAEFRFARGERKEFYKHWSQLFRVSDDEWEPAEPGTYVIGAEINVAGDAELTGETTVEIRPD